MKFTQATAITSTKIQRVGVVGGGQLAWMMGAAASRLGIELVVQTPHATDPAISVAADSILAGIDDVNATAELATRCDVITFENEFVDLDGLRILEKQGILFQPSLSSLDPLLDKYVQRCYLQDLGLPTPRFWQWDCSQDLPLDFPFVIKVRRHGYDGQGTFVVKDSASFESICVKLKNLALLVEEFVPFDRELAVIAARSTTGEIAIYPIVETQQEHEVCRLVIAPAQISLQVKAEAEAIAHTLLNSLQAVGVFGIELFLTSDNQLLVNEIAPRTHNSGHFTIDACKTSQFEQHLRAVCQLPLGNCDLNSAGAVMVNLLGYKSAESDYLEKRKQLAQLNNTFVHWYGKKVSRPGRKLGHVTVLLDREAVDQGRVQVDAIAQTIESIWYAN
ncbi:5-(carboxyamino)imidazole ribonucleotide synthase [Tychonema sp. BBK16]|uniref:5-(carboxyamino)imidazole ribonucleotide synthase n=1 Tax=Tychonema sp. BBK16 TaxID=2699888 RepID=UPI001F2ADCB9|nr:5-(carboxyamino)imidazole ribonucleotide synthase [Tychonema sp. BBK16]MCF6374502.1 5-(carboxyamino)imidazole ribonucleotide synthase [Tychonema sp. BBK16]